MGWVGASGIAVRAIRVPGYPRHFPELSHSADHHDKGCGAIAEIVCCNVSITSIYHVIRAIHRRATLKQGLVDAFMRVVVETVEPELSRRLVLRS